MKTKMKSKWVKMVALVGVGVPLAVLSAPSSMAGPTEYTSEINMTAANYCPRGTYELKGQLLPVSQNTALFSLLGTNFGGDGRTTFGMPDMRGRVPVSNGRGPGLSDWRLGQRGGSETMSLNVSTLPAHHHALSQHTHGIGAHTHDSGIVVSNSGPDTHDPKGASIATYPTGGGQFVAGAPNNGGAMATETVIIGSTITEINNDGGGGGGEGTTGLTGGSVSVDHKAPYIGIRFCMTINGIYPSRN